MTARDDLNALVLVARPGPVRLRSPYRVSHHRRRRRTLPAASAAAAAPAAFAVANGGFEAGLAGWKPLFTREPQTGQAESDRDQFHAGSGAAKITHPGQADWSFETSARLPVVPGDLIELHAWVKIDGPGGVTLSASTWGRTARSSAGRSALALRGAAPAWHAVQTRFVVPPGVTASSPRTATCRRRPTPTVLRSP